MELFEKSLQFATEKHRGQIRKRNKLPYILHPLEVATIAATLSADEELLAAALLHDTIEDAGVTPEELYRLFGERVTALVLSETEDKHFEQTEEESWEIRKKESLELLKNAEDNAVRQLWLSDKLSNMRSFSRQHREEGDAMWQHYHQKDAARQAWYYFEIARALSPLSNTDAYLEYLQLVKEVFSTELASASDLFTE